MLVTEHHIEQAIIGRLETDNEFVGYTTVATLHALNPQVYNFNNAAGGVVLVSCAGTNYTGIKQFRSNAGAEYRVTVALGIMGIKDNTKLWAKKAALFQTLAYQRLMPELSKLTPINDVPLYPEAIDGVFWVKIEFMVTNYTGL